MQCRDKIKLNSLHKLLYALGEKEITTLKFAKCIQKCFITFLVLKILNYSDTNLQKI